MTAEKKVLLLVCDGLGDRPVPALDGQTPLQAARTENLDWFARHGASGLVDLVAPGVRPGSDTAHLALFGYDPYEAYTGRGPFEAAGVGLTVEPGDVALRCNFATLDERGRIVDRRAGRIRRGTGRLAEALAPWETEGVELRFREGTEHRAALVLHGEGLDPRITDADPHATGVPVAEVEPLAPDAAKTARVVNAFVTRARKVLADHPLNRERAASGQPPANAILPRGAGSFPRISRVGERWGLRFGAIAGVALIRGICDVVGMELLDVEGATGGLDTDMVAKMNAGIRALETFDVVVVNIKAPDIAGHDGKPRQKVEAIERVNDSLEALRERFDPGWVFGVTADHSTPCVTGDHTADPVPLVIYGEGLRRDDTPRFDEIAAAQGGLGRLRGQDVLPLLLDAANRTEKFGA